MVAHLGWADFGLGVPSSCPAAQPVMPNSLLPKQNPAGKIRLGSPPNPGARPPVALYYIGSPTL